ncbi:hypothetical protein EXH46_21775 [Pelomonas puraquae]|nr:hypothetical protein [Roseateles puraquae]
MSSAPSRWRAGSQALAGAVLRACGSSVTAAATTATAAPTAIAGAAIAARITAAAIGHPAATAAA